MPEAPKTRDNDRERDSGRERKLGLSPSKE
jgi:hypothetical protein